MKITNNEMKYVIDRVKQKEETNDLNGYLGIERFVEQENVVKNMPSINEDIISVPLNINFEDPEVISDLKAISKAKNLEIISDKIDNNLVKLVRNQKRLYVGYKNNEVYLLQDLFVQDDIIFDLSNQKYNYLLELLARVKLEQTDALSEKLARFIMDRKEPSNEDYHRYRNTIENRWINNFKKATKQDETFIENLKYYIPYFKMEDNLSFTYNQHENPLNQNNLLSQKLRPGKFLVQNYDNNPIDKNREYQIIKKI